MKKRLVCLLLCCAMLFGLVPLYASAESVQVVFDQIDAFIYAGGTFDAEVYVDTTSTNIITYQWQADPSFGDGHWMDLEDNDAWKGTDTKHLQLLTHTNTSNVIGSGWDDIPFRCLVTVDGKSYPSQLFHINILPFAQLFTDMKRTKQGDFRAFLDEINLSEDDEFYFCQAGSSFSFSLSDVSTGSDESAYLEESEVVFVPEIIVTEDGQITNFLGNGIYMPRSVGTSVSVQFRLSLEIGGNKVNDPINELTTNIRVTEPNVIGSAQTRYAFSLCEYPYNESRKLISVPKNDGVYLIEPCGSNWWLVSYKGTIGYAATASLVIKQFISEVDVRLDTPIAGQVADFVAETDDKTYSSYIVDWYDKTDAKFLSADDRFVAGHTYAATVWLKTVDGCQFTTNVTGNPTVIGKLNGETLQTKRPYEQDPSYVIELYKIYDPLPASHTCTRVFVAQKDPTCTEAGLQAYYRCECGKIYLNATGGSAIAASEVPTIAPSGHTESSWIITEYNHYKKCLTCGIQLPGTEGPHGGGVASVESGPACATCGIEYGDPVPHTHTFVPKQSEYMHWNECTACGGMEQMELHTFVNGVCSDCGYKEVRYDEVSFSDVPEGAYYEKAVLWAVEEGITTGTSATTFSPNANCSRAQAVTFLWRATGSPLPSVMVKQFADVPAKQYYSDAVLWAVGSDITSGTSATTFSPNTDCTRAQIVTFLWRMSGCPEVSGTNHFTDVPANTYYYDAVLWAVNRGITNGTSSTTFSPNTVCTRGQIVTFLYRALGGSY